MHKYTIEKSPKVKIIIIITIISGVIAGIITTFFEMLGIIHFSIGVPTISAFIYFIFKKFLWNIKNLNKLLGHPNLNGIWKVNGISINKEKDEEFSWNGEITIKQNLDEILITLITENSKSSSQSTSGNIEYIAGQGFRVNYNYINKPNSTAPEELRTHEGYCSIVFSESNNTAEGNYFNNNRDRATHGIMKLQKVV